MPLIFTFGPWGPRCFTYGAYIHMGTMGVQALPVYQIKAQGVLYLLRKSMPLVFTFGHLGPMAFDLWDRDYQKMNLGACGYQSVKYGPWGYCGS